MHNHASEGWEQEAEREIEINRARERETEKKRKKKNATHDNSNKVFFCFFSNFCGFFSVLLSILLFAAYVAHMSIRNFNQPLCSISARYCISAYLYVHIYSNRLPVLKTYSSHP